MKKIIIASSIALCLNASLVAESQANYSEDPKQKESEKTNEMIGFGSGALLGAGVGGPLGAVVGGIFGLLVANDVNSDNQIEQSKNDLSLAKNKLNKNQEQLKQIESELAQAQHQHMMQVASFDEASHQAFIEDLAEFETNLQFKTASFALEDIYKEQLDKIASILNNYPQLSVDLVGYADQRGDESYNRELSELRAKAVKEYLVSNGVALEQISMTGAGEKSIANIQSKNEAENMLENTALINNLEDLFFARTVELSFSQTTQNMTAAN